MLTDSSMRGDEPQARAIAAARISRKQENGRPKFLMADLLPLKTSGEDRWLPIHLL
jgi:hypothetical protein